jgi:hypothetical protein
MIFIWSIEWIEGERPGGHILASGSKFPCVVLKFVFQVEEHILTSMNAKDLVINDNT